MDIVYANANASVAVEGISVTLHEGDHYEASDPVVLANPGMFSSDPMTGIRYSPTTGRPVERATRAPGERRLNVGR